MKEISKEAEKVLLLRHKFLDLKFLGFILVSKRI